MMLLAILLFCEVAHAKLDGAYLDQQFPEPKGAPHLRRPFGDDWIVPQAGKGNSLQEGHDRWHSKTAGFWASIEQAERDVADPYLRALVLLMVAAIYAKPCSPLGCLNGHTCGLDALKTLVELPNEIYMQAFKKPKMQILKPIIEEYCAS